MSLVQIIQRSGRIERVPRGSQPVIELYLDENQYVTDMHLRAVSGYDSMHPSDRTTTDYAWSCFVVTRL